MKALRRVPLALLILFQAIVLGPTPAQSASTLAPDNGVLFGAWVGQRGDATHYDAVLRFESQIGRQLEIDMHYRNWNNRFWGEEALDIAAGRIPFITWDVRGEGQAVDINAGVHDTLIREKADAIEALGGRVLLRWGAEMNGGRYGPAAEYIAAWKRIQGIFAAQGATNVEWVWCPMAWSFVSGTAPAYYPGDANVDWICADGFNWYPAMPPWKSFTKIFEAFYEWGSKHGKPLIIGEVGTMEDPAMPGRKAAWFDSIVPALKAWPAIKAIVYFHSVSPKGYTFWADTSTSALTAFRRLASDPYLAAQAGSSDPPPASGGCTQTGTSGADHLVGTDGDDVLCGHRGNDVIEGLGGNDTLRGGRGNDELTGGSEGDKMYGEAGDDRLYGIYGHDNQYGGDGNDFLGGGEGSDTQYGGAGRDTCRQGAGTGARTGCEHLE